MSTHKNNQSSYSRGRKSEKEQRLGYMFREKEEGEEDREGRGVDGNEEGRRGEGRRYISNNKVAGGKIDP